MKLSETCLFDFIYDKFMTCFGISRSFHLFTIEPEVKLFTKIIVHSLPLRMSDSDGPKLLARGFPVSSRPTTASIPFLPY